MTQTVERVALEHGVVGFIARDPGDGRWLWSVRWGVNRRKEWYTTAHRYGKALTNEQAMTAIMVAWRQGRP